MQIGSCFIAQLHCRKWPRAYLAWVNDGHHSALCGQWMTWSLLANNNNALSINERHLTHRSVAFSACKQTL